MLKVHSNQRVLTQSGKPFFYMGDTAWELFHRLSWEEAKLYFDNRAELGFNVVQAVLLAEADGITAPNANGDCPLVEEDVIKLNEAYFAHCDRLVEYANQKGIVMGILPTWGKYWTKRAEQKRYLDTGNAYAYGKLLGQRYRDAELIWILGGDTLPMDEEERETMVQLALGLREGDSGNHLITFHPLGPGQSSVIYHNESWLDFNMSQSSHGAHDHFNGLFIQHDYALTPAKPTLDGEPRYEQMQVGFYNRVQQVFDRFDDFDVRQAAYFAVFCGACGHTYGNNNIWQMWIPGRKPLIGADIPWMDALHHPGARQMGYLRTLMEDHHFESLRPAQEVLLDGPDRGGERVLALSSEDRNTVLVYSPYGRRFSLDNTRRNGLYEEVWFDPRYNISHFIHKGVNQGMQTYTPPTEGRGQDWVLLVRKLEEKVESRKDDF